MPGVPKAQPDLDQGFRLGAWLVNPRSNELIRDGHPPVRVEGKVMKVLLYLAEGPGNVRSKEEIIAHVWPDVIVGEHTLFRCIRELRRAFEDDARSPVYIENLPKVGYRLLVDIGSANRAGADSGPTIAPTLSPTPKLDVQPLRSRKQGWFLGSFALFIFLVGLGLLAGVLPPDSLSEGSSAEAEAAGPTVAVLPMVVLDGQGTRDDRAGILLADSLAFRLSELDGVRVVSSSALHYRNGGEVDPRKAGSELGVQALLVGKIVRTGPSFSITVELIDSASNEILWGNAFTGQVAKADELADQLAEEVRGRIESLASNR